jgi:hypothetical protein
MSQQLTFVVLFGGLNGLWIFSVMRIFALARKRAVGSPEGRE